MILDLNFLRGLRLEVHLESTVERLFYKQMLRVAERRGEDFEDSCCRESREREGKTPTSSRMGCRLVRLSESQRYPQETLFSSTTFETDPFHTSTVDFLDKGLQPVSRVVFSFSTVWTSVTRHSTKVSNDLKLIV